MSQEEFTRRHTKLVAKYGLDFSRLGYPSYRNMLFILPIALKAKIIVETGLSLGFSAEIFLNAVKFTGGHLYTYDIEDRPETRERIAEHGLAEHWTFIQSGSVKAGQEWNKGEIDLLYLDSDHSQSHVLRELKVWTPHVKDGLVLIHDTRHEKQPLSCQSLEAVDQFVRQNDGWSVVNLNDPLGIACLWRVKP